MSNKQAGLAESAAEREIVITRVIHAPRARVFEAMTDPKQVSKWWGPNGFTDTTHEMDVRPGGVWRHTMHGPDGTDYPNKSVFNEVAAPERIVLSVSGGTREKGGVSFQATWTFEELGENATRVTIRSVFPTAEMRNHVVKTYGAIEGGHQTLGRLNEFLLAKPEFELVMERVIQAPPARVFQAWADPKQVVHWFAPKPFQLVIRKMDFRAGGKFDMSMQGPDGADHAFSGTYREVIPPSKLSWTGEFPGDVDDNIWTTVTFEDLGGKTKLHVRQIFHRVRPEVKFATQGARQGWTMTLDQLEGFVKSAA